jgi:hypothetical protein
MDNVLARKTSDIRTRAANQAPLDHYRTIARLRERPRQVLARFATADDDEVIPIDRRHMHLLAHVGMSYSLEQAAHAPTPYHSDRGANVACRVADAFAPATVMSQSPPWTADLADLRRQKGWQGA